MMCRLLSFLSHVPTLVTIIQLYICKTVHSQLLGPTNISRQIGDTNVIIPCPYISIVSPPVWNIGGKLYDYTALPSPYTTATGGDLVITTVDNSLDKTSFQCIVLGTNGEILKSDIGIIAVTGNHDGMSLMTFAWKTVNNGTDCQHYSFSSSDCDPAINFQHYLDESRDKMIKLKDVVGSPYYNISAFTDNSNICKFSSPLQRFQVQNSAYTKLVTVALSSRICTSCFEVPSLDVTLTVSTAIPFRQPNDTLEPQPDLLCYLLFNESSQCVNLRGQCDHFDDSIYPESIRVCRRANSTNTEMCLSNFGSMMNDTIIHFFTSLANCSVNSVVQFTRLYIGSTRIITQKRPGDFNVMLNISTQQLCIYTQPNECYELDDLDETAYIVSVAESNGNNIVSRTLNVSSGCIIIKQVVQLRCTAPLILLVNAMSRILLYEPLMIILRENNTARDSCECSTSNVHKNNNLDVSEGPIKYNCSCELLVSELSPKVCSDSNNSELLAIILPAIIVLIIIIIILSSLIILLSLQRKLGKENFNNANNYKEAEMKDPAS